jgi:hypothetical protein
LTVAVDHLHCLRSSLAGDLKGDRLSVRIHTHAQSSLIRGAIENGARAVWLLGPTRRLIRVTRRLSLEAMEIHHSYQLRELVGAPARRTQDQRKKQLQDLAVAAGVPGLDVKKALRPPRYSEIVREGGHGELSGTLGMLDKEILARDKDIAYARVTGSISGLYWTTAGAVRMIGHGFDLYSQRATRHY